MTDPAQYRRSPRQRVAYIQPDDVDPDPQPEEFRWPGPRPDMYETDWEHHRRRRGRRSGRTMPVLMAMGVVIAAAAGVVVVQRAEQPATAPVAIDAAIEPKATAATRRAPRAPAASSSAASAPRAARAARLPEPVTGLSQAQMNNAAVIVEVAQDRGLPRRAMLVAMMTGLQESSLRNLANPTVPASLDRPNEGSGANFDSLGVFQQRPSQGWGTVAQLMNPRYAADAFYKRLLRVTDWDTQSPGDAAQAVQRSALPDAYAAHEERATKLLDALL